MKTYNEIISIIKDISEKHKMVNSVGFGEGIDISNLRTGSFPMVYIQPSDVGLNKTYIDYNFYLFGLDQLQRGGGNRDEIFSDMLKVLVDITLKLDLDIEVIFGNGLDPTFQNYDQILAGWMMRLTIRETLDVDQCLLPFVE